MKMKSAYSVPEARLYSIGIYGGMVCVSYGDAGYAGTDPTEDEVYDL